MLILAQDRCTVCAERTIGSKIILTHLTVLLGDVGQVEARFGRLEIVLVSAQDRCMVSADFTTSMKPFWA
jgi:hypothetical protein